MTKTIEEAANEYADNAYYPAPDYNWYESDDEQMKECLSDTFKAGAHYVYGLPLASRLTAEEKESIKETYKYHLNAIGDCYTHCMVRDELEHIFGKDFFKEDKV